MSDPHPELLASDAERDQAAAILRTGLSDGRLTVSEFEQRLQSVYAVRTRGELEPLIADVNAQALETRAAAAPPAPRTDGTRWIVSIMSGTKRHGTWRVGGHCTVLDVMGGSDIDLTEADLGPGETEIRVLCVMGGSKIRVPDGVRVEVSKLAVMGGNDVRLSDASPPADASVIRLRLLTIMGGVNVRQGVRKRKQLRS